MTSGQPKRVVLAYSGGLDTSVILAWLIEKGYEVVCFCANVGQEDDDLDAIKTKALKIGAVSCHVEDLRKQFVTDYIFPTLQAAALYEHRYLLGTAIARPLIAKALVECARMENCKYLAHGATGKGNDQVRFELSAMALDPTLEMIAPWRDAEFLQQFKGRIDLLQYAADHGVVVDQTPKKSYSIDENLFHTSFESGCLEDPAVAPQADMFLRTVDVSQAPDRKESIKIDFENGVAVRVTNLDSKELYTDPLELFIYLNKLGKKNGIGRIDIVENRFVGIKSRGVYETPGGTILWAAHRDIEGIAMDREVMRLRDMLSPKFAELAYNGFWFSPEMDFLCCAIRKSQELIDGTVFLSLYKGNVIIDGRESNKSLYNRDLASMDVEGHYDPVDATGFIKINALRLRAHRALLVNTDPSRYSKLTMDTPSFTDLQDSHHESSSS